MKPDAEAEVTLYYCPLSLQNKVIYRAECLRPLGILSAANPRRGTTFGACFWLWRAVFGRISSLMAPGFVVVSPLGEAPFNLSALYIMTISIQRIAPTPNPAALARVHPRTEREEQHREKGAPQKAKRSDNDGN